MEAPRDNNKAHPDRKGPGHSGSGKVELGEGGFGMSASVIEAVFDIRMLTIRGGPGQQLSGELENALRTDPRLKTKETVIQVQITDHVKSRGH